MYTGGEPKLEVLSEGLFTCTHFFGGNKFKASSEVPSEGDNNQVEQVHAIIMTVIQQSFMMPVVHL